MLSCQSELVLLNVGASANLSYHSTAPVDQVVRRAHSIYISKKAALSSSSFSISTSTPQLVVGIVVTRRHDRARPFLRIFNNVFSPFLFVLDACVKISKDFIIWMMIGHFGEHAPDASLSHAEETVHDHRNFLKPLDFHRDHNWNHVSIICLYNWCTTTVKIQRRFVVLLPELTSHNGVGQVLRSSCIVLFASIRCRCRFWKHTLGKIHLVIHVSRNEIKSLTSRSKQWPFLYFCLTFLVRSKGIDMHWLRWTATLTCCWYKISVGIENRSEWCRGVSNTRGILSTSCVAECIAQHCTTDKVPPDAFAWEAQKLSGLEFPCNFKRWLKLWNMFVKKIECWHVDSS